MIRAVELVRTEEIARVLAVAGGAPSGLDFVGIAELADGRRVGLAIGDYGRFHAVERGVAHELPARLAVEAYGLAVLRAARSAAARRSRS
jgi:hypothetical protein